MPRRKAASHCKAAAPFSFLPVFSITSGHHALDRAGVHQVSGADIAADTESVMNFHHFSRRDRKLVAGGQCPAVSFDERIVDGHCALAANPNGGSYSAPGNNVGFIHSDK